MNKTGGATAESPHRVDQPRERTRVLAHLRSHLTYANVMSTIAVFVVLGGGAYAAATLPKNSVGTAQLKKNAVTAAKVKDRSLLAKDFKAGQLAAGPTGATGPTGPAGPKGDKGDPGANGTDGAKGDQGDIGPRGPSNGRHLTGPDVMDLDNTTGSELLSPSLSNGSFLVTAKVNLDNQGVGAATVDCRLLQSNGPDDDTASVDLGADGGQDQDQLTLQGKFSNNDPSLVFLYLLACDDNGGTVTATKPIMSIVQVDALSG
jgi:hypothetical protein